MSKKRIPIPITDHEWLLIWGSLRYFCGRMSIQSACYPAMLVEHYYARMDDGQRIDLAKEIQRVLDEAGGIGHRDIDEPIWERLKGALNVSLHRTVTLIDGSECRIFEANGRIYPLDEYLAEPWVEMYLPTKNIAKEQDNGESN